MRYPGSGKSTNEDYRSIDVRWLHRKGMLDRTWPQSITWSRNGEIIASIGLRRDSGSVILTYRHQRCGSEWEQLSYPVYLDWTPCNYGGSRPWFLCPARGCGRRVAVLYSGRIFACRHCYGLAFESQHEAPHGRALRRMQRIREKMGGSGSMAEDFPDKPKWMHWKTYSRLCQEYERAEGHSWPPFLLRSHLNHS